VILSSSYSAALAIPLVVIKKFIKSKNKVVRIISYIFIILLIIISWFVVIVIVGVAL